MDRSLSYSLPPPVLAPKSHRSSRLRQSSCGFLPCDPCSLSYAKRHNDGSDAHDLIFHRLAPILPPMLIPGKRRLFLVKMKCNHEPVLMVFQVGMKARVKALTQTTHIADLGRVRIQPLCVTASKHQVARIIRIPVGEEHFHTLGCAEHKCLDDFTERRKVERVLRIKHPVNNPPVQNLVGIHPREAVRFW